MHKTDLRFKTNSFIIDGKVFLIEKATPLCWGPKKITAKTENGNEIILDVDVTLLKAPGGSLFYITRYNDFEYAAPIKKIDEAAAFYKTAPLHYAGCEEFGVVEA